MATKTKRVLCSSCHQSFDPDDVKLVGRGFRCESCQGGAATRNEPCSRVVRESYRPIPEKDPAKGSKKSLESQGSWRDLHHKMEDWCEGRLWWARAPLWSYFAYGLIRHWFQPGDYRSILDSLNLGIHEL